MSHFEPKPRLDLIITKLLHNNKTQPVIIYAAWRHFNLPKSVSTNLGVECGPVDLLQLILLPRWEKREF